MHLSAFVVKVNYITDLWRCTDRKRKHAATNAFKVQTWWIRWIFSQETTIKPKTKRSGNLVILRQTIEINIHIGKYSINDGSCIIKGLIHLDWEKAKNIDSKPTMAKPISKRGYTFSVTIAVKHQWDVTSKNEWKVPAHKRLCLIENPHKGTPAEEENQLEGDISPNVAPAVVKTTEWANNNEKTQKNTGIAISCNCPPS